MAAPHDDDEDDGEILPRAGSVASDGGPILLGPRRAFRSWTGARADGAPEGDYHDACRSPGGYGVLARDGASITVLPTYAVDALVVEDGALWLTLEGNLEELWAARSSIQFRPLGRAIDADELLLLDAAYPLERAEREVERVFTLPRLADRYELDEGTEAPTGGYFRVLRLRPA